MLKRAQRSASEILRDGVVAISVSAGFQRPVTEGRCRSSATNVGVKTVELRVPGMSRSIVWCSVGVDRGQRKA